MPLAERTILDIEARILHRAHLRYEELSLTYDATDGKNILRQIVNDTQSRLNGYREWTFSTKKFTLQGTGAQSITLPGDFNREIRLVNSTDHRPIDVIPWTEFLDRYLGLESTGTAWAAAFPDQGHVNMYPWLAVGNSVDLHYVGEMPDFVNDNDVPNVPLAIMGAYNRALIEGSLIEVLEYAENYQAATRQETSKYPIALRELAKVAGAGNSTFHVRENSPGSNRRTRFGRAFIGGEYPV